MVKLSFIPSLCGYLRHNTAAESCWNTYLDSSYVIFKCFAFLDVWDKFESLGNVQAAMMI